MTIVCTQCQEAIDPKLANVKTDLIQCPSCHAVHELSELVKTKTPIPLEFTPPTGSKISITHTTSTLIMRIPPRKLKLSDVLPLLIGVFLIYFSVNDFIQQGLPNIFNLVSLLTLFGVGMWILVNTLTGITEHQFIELDKIKLKISKKGLFSLEKINIELKDIHKIEMSQNVNKKMESPTIVYGIENATLLENLTEQEKEWGLNLLKASLMQFAEKKV